MAMYETMYEIVGNFLLIFSLNLHTGPEGCGIEGVWFLSGVHAIHFIYKVHTILCATIIV